MNHACSPCDLQRHLPHAHTHSYTVTAELATVTNTNEEEQHESFKKRSSSTLCPEGSWPLLPSSQPSMEKDLPLLIRRQQQQQSSSSSLTASRNHPLHHVPSLDHHHQQDLRWLPTESLLQPGQRKPPKYRLPTPSPVSPLSKEKQEAMLFRF